MVKKKIVGNTIRLCAGSLSALGTFTSSGRLRLCERQLLQVLIVGIGHFRCRLHLDCLAVQRELPRRTVLSVRCRQKQIKKSERGGVTACGSFAVG